MYEIILTDRAFVPQGHVTEASNLRYFRGVSKMSTFAFHVPLRYQYSQRLSTVDGYIKVYRKGALMFVGPIVTAEENAEREARSVAVTAADAAWTLSRRVCGKSTTGIIYNTPTARDVLAKRVLDDANTDGETGVSATDFAFSSGSAITYKIGPYANALQTIQELGDALDGFDWIIRPKENWINGLLGGTKIGSMQIATTLGSTKADSVFEYGAGTRSNVLSYKMTTTRDQQANKVFHVNTDASNAKTGTNNAAITAWGLLEDTVQGEFSDATMRQQLVDEHSTVRGNPRTLIRMTPHIDPGDAGHVPEPFVDYDVGDILPFRAVGEGVVRFSGNVRVYAIVTTIDEAGFERVELVLEDE